MISKILCVHYKENRDPLTVLVEKTTEIAGDSIVISNKDLLTDATSFRIFEKQDIESLSKTGKDDLNEYKPRTLQSIRNEYSDK